MNDTDAPTYCIGTSSPRQDDEGALLKWVVGRPPFNSRQVYDDKPVRQIACGLCGCDKFEVAQGSALTAIRCACCGQELCVHDG